MKDYEILDITVLEYKADIHDQLQNRLLSESDETFQIQKETYSKKDITIAALSFINENLTYPDHDSQNYMKEKSTIFSRPATTTWL